MDFNQGHTLLGRACISITMAPLAHEPPACCLLLTARCSTQLLAALAPARSSSGGSHCRTSTSTQNATDRASLPQMVDRYRLAG